METKKFRIVQLSDKLFRVEEQRRFLFIRYWHGVGPDYFFSNRMAAVRAVKAARNK